VLSSCLSISGATTESYTLAQADIGSTIRVQESATNFYGTGVPATSAPSGVIGSVPTSHCGPTISGAVVVGRTLSESHATWSYGPAGYSYEWQGCDMNGAPGSCQTITGATSSSYVLTAADIGATIRDAENASNSYGSSAPAYSAPTGVIGALPVNTAQPAISGSAVEGQVLSEHQGTWSNLPSTFQYQWERCDANGRACTAIAGATGSSYTLARTDVGSAIAVQEIASNGFGSGQRATSRTTAPVSDAPISVVATALLGTVKAVINGQVATFTDPGDPGASPAGYKATIDWGDHSSSHGNVESARSGGGFVVTAAHAYKRSGIYSMTVTLHAVAGATSSNSTRISVLPAAICTGRTKGKSCLGQLNLPAGCLLRDKTMPVWLTRPSVVKSVRYSIDRSKQTFPGKGRKFLANLPVAGLKSGTHKIIAVITYTRGQPRTGTVIAPFIVC
jgi:hypothetical protein